jgi:D-alanyl-D-alanine carboxypeptidase
LATRIRSTSTARELVPLIAEAGLAFEPGSKTEYSNGGFVLLGAIVEAASGKTFRDYVRANILVKAGMTSTRFDEPPDGPVRLSQMAPGAPAGGRSRTRMDAGATPAGGGYSSARDLARFANALRRHRLVSASTLKTMMTIRSQPRSVPGRPSAERRGYGYGFGITETGSDTVVGHNGGAPGTNAEVAVSLRNGWSLVALSNIDPPAATNAMTFARQVIGSGSGTSAQCDAIAATPGPFDGSN